MNWNVHYREGLTDHVVRFQSPERAIEAACHLLDHGSDVHHIRTRAKAKTLDKEQIARIYAVWARARYH